MCTALLLWHLISVTFSPAHCVNTSWVLQTHLGSSLALIWARHRSCLLSAVFGLLALGHSSSPDPELRPHCGDFISGLSMDWPWICIPLYCFFLILWERYILISVLWTKVFSALKITFEYNSLRSYALSSNQSIHKLKVLECSTYIK